MIAAARWFRPIGPVLITVTTCLVIALGWFGAYSAIVAHRAVSRARVESEVHSKAALIAEQLRRELLVTDQTLHILEIEWERDPAGFDFNSWRQRALALTDISLQIFIADAHGIVRFSSRPDIIGDNISGRDYFRHAAALPADDGRMFIGALTRGLITRQWQLNMERRLDYPDGSFGGVIAASFDASVFTMLQQEANLGSGGLLLVSTTDGAIRGIGNLEQAQVDAAASLTGSPVFKEMQRSANGEWVGPSPLDRVKRVLAFATIPGRGLQVLVGEDEDQAMRSATEWEQEALTFTGVATVLVLVMAAVLLWAEQASRARHSATLRDRAALRESNIRLEAAQQRERAKAAQLAATLAGMSDGIMMVDADLRLLAWNEHFPEFTGVPGDILRPGLPMEDMLRGQAEAGEFGAVDVEAEVARRLALLRHGGSIGRIERQRPDGRVLEIRRNPLAGAGFVTLYSDITDRRRAEDRARQAQTMAAIGRLTSGVAHDFNNLLASISGNAEMLLNDLGADPREARRLRIIEQAAGRGAELVRQLLAFARKQSLAPQQVDLNAVLSNIEALLKTTLGAMVRVDMELNPGLWPALVDPTQIEHVVLNLAINARDAMPDGGLLTIATSNIALDPLDAHDDLTPGDYVVIVVRDTGTGMTEEVQRNAFEPFFTTKPPGRGSGLGLSQVYGVTRQSGGSVRIDSAPGQGTSVMVFLPRAPADAAAVSAPEVPSDKAAGTTPRPRTVKGATVLLVDDEETVRTTIGAMVESAGFSLLTAASGSAALELVRSGVAFDLLMVDFAMPGMTGLAVAQVVRERRPSASVVFITGYGDDERIEGERWILRKPFAVEAMTEMLGEALAAASQWSEVG
jgi:signal transduction histidine kinase/CheY-like chemotaxis protein